MTSRLTKGGFMKEGRKILDSGEVLSWGPNLRGKFVACIVEVDRHVVVETAGVLRVLRPATKGEINQIHE